MTEPSLQQALQQALDHHREGRSAAAETLYRAILEIQPEHPEANYNLGRLMAETNRPAAALPWLRTALEASPAEPEHWRRYAEALEATGHHEPAQAILELARAHGVSSTAGAARAPQPPPPTPEMTSAEHQTLVELFQAQRFDEAETRLQRLLAQHPRDGFLWKVRGSILTKQFKNEAALAALRTAQELSPDDPEIPNTLGVVLKNLGRLEDAVECYRQALTLAPHYLEAHYNLGYACKSLGLWREAEEHYRRVTMLAPERAEAHSNLGNFLLELWRLQEAEACYRQALALAPNRVETHANLASVLQALGRWGDAESALHEALKLAPDSSEAHNNLGTLLKTMGRLSDAQTAYRRAIELNPSLAETHSNLGTLLAKLGRPHEAEASLRQALAIHPGDPRIYSNLLFTAANSGAHSPDSMRWEAQGWERACLSAAMREQSRRHRFDPPARQGRPLRLGVLSAELGRHAVAYFLLSWLPRLDRDRIKLHLYPVRSRRDPQAETFRQLADAWTPLNHLNDMEAAAHIRADQIDVLIDTSGHTAGNRLGVIAHRAAPVQCHYIGYFSTTGLTEMDWLIADSTLIPPTLDAQFTERVWRLERPWMAYAPLEEAPEPEWQPDPGGTLWLGSFNSLAKISDDCLRLWARVLHALPNSRLLLKDRMSQDPNARARIERILAHSSIAADRIVFRGRDVSWRDHMAHYNRIDIALDPTPVTGGSTCFDALWMGVPLVTLISERLIGRQGAAVLAGLGRPEWITSSPEDYVQLVLALAQDVEGRRHVRLAQRERMRNGPLCDGAGMAHALEDAFERMFDAWWHSRSQGPSGAHPISHPSGSVST